MVMMRGRASQADRAVHERARSSQPADGRSIDSVGPRHIGHRLTSSKALQRFLALMRRHLARTSEAHAAILRTLAALACASADQLTLELGKPAEDGQHQLAVRRRGVSPGILE